MDEVLELNQLLRCWLAWYRLRQGVRWALRGALLGLALALFLAGISILQGRLVAEEFWRLVAGGGLTGLILAGFTAVTWPVPHLEAARFFDHQFGLQERISTALELATEPIVDPADLEIRQKQLEDALKTARRVDIYRIFPLRLNWLEIGLLAVFLLTSFLTTRWAIPYFEAAHNLRSIQQAISEQAAQVESLRQQVGKMETLTPEQRQALSSPLEEALRKLQEAKTLEQAASAINDAQQKLAGLSSDQSQQQAQALQETGEQLSALQDSPLQEFGKDLAAGDTQTAAQALQNIDPSSLDAAQREALANDLSHAAAMLRASDPQLAENLQAAGEALQNSGQQAQSNQEATSSLGHAAQMLQGKAQDQSLAQAAAQTSAQLGQGQQQMIAQAGQSGAGSQGQTAAGSQNGESQQSGQNSGGGAGRGEQSGTSGTGSEAGTNPIQQNNGPGDGGETQYEQIYAPQRLGGSDGQDVQLPGSGQPGNQVTGQSEAAPGSPGLSTVPYTEALSDYQDAYYQAIESGQIPVHLRNLIRDYFSSLEP